LPLNLRNATGWTSRSRLPSGGIDSRALGSRQLPENIKAARDRESKGLLTSDLYRKPWLSPGSSVARGSVSFGVRNPYPIELAQRNYIQLNGNKAFSKAVMDLLNATLS